MRAVGSISHINLDKLAGFYAVETKISGLRVRELVFKQVEFSRRSNENSYFRGCRRRIVLDITKGCNTSTKIAASL